VGRCCRAFVLPTGLFGTLLAVVGLLIAAQPVAASTEPIVEYLEFNESGVLSYADAIINDYSANSEEPRFPETSLTGGKLEINELFIRYLPDSGIADVFISAQVVGELDGCSSSMSTLNQTTVDPVVVADGSATAVIDASWNWTRQLNQGGVCLEKITVAQWTETYTIDLTFADGATSAVVAYGNQVESLGSAPPPDRPETPVQTVATLPATPVIPGVDAGAPPSEFGDEPSDAGDSSDVADQSTTEAADAEPDEQAATGSDSNGRNRLAIIGLGLAVLLMLWAFFSVTSLRQMLVAVIRTLSPWSEPARPKSDSAPDLKTYGQDDDRVTYQTTIEALPPPPVFKIMGTAKSNYRYVEAKAEHGNRFVRLETGTTVEVIEREHDKALVRLPGEGPAMWVCRKDIQMENPARSPER